MSGGKKYKIFKLLYFMIKSRIFFGFFKNNNCFLKKFINFDQKTYNYFLTFSSFKIDDMLWYYFYNTDYMFNFFLNKKKTYINHRQVFLDKITYIIVERENKKYLFRFIKIMYLKNRYKSFFVNLFSDNVFSNHRETTMFYVFGELSMRFLV